MADSKITALTALTAADPANDMLPVVDVSDTSMAASGTTKRISINNILACSPSATLASATISGQLTAATSSGHVGFGTNPSSWGSSIKGVDVGAWTSVAQIGAASFLGFNSYASTTGQFNYKNSGAIALGYFQQSAGHLWLNAPSNAGAVGANATFTTAMTLDTSGRLLVGPTSANANGGILQLSSGITFPATQVASSDANTLDDYEEGTWVGTLKGSVSDPTTPVTSTGRYTKIGRAVQIAISFAAVNTTGASGSISISGLPFAAANDGVGGVGSASFYSAATFTGYVTSFVASNASVVDFYWSQSAGVNGAATHNAGTNRYVNTNIVYYV